MDVAKTLSLPHQPKPLNIYVTIVALCCTGPHQTPQHSYTVSHSGTSCNPQCYNSTFPHLACGAGFSSAPSQESCERPHKHHGAPSPTLLPSPTITFHLSSSNRPPFHIHLSLLHSHFTLILITITIMIILTSASEALDLEER